MSPDLGTTRKILRSLRWLPSYAWQRLVRRPAQVSLPHFIIAVANHFEPAFSLQPCDARVSLREQIARVQQWYRDYRAKLGQWRDSDGRPLRHTYFYPAEDCDTRIISEMADHCHAGWGEIEVHLHHGVRTPDTAENTRRALIEFRNVLVAHGCLSRWENGGPPRYGFVHGNWALANSMDGQFCGVDDEIQILAETGCYADFTLPSAPERAQVRKINALYECALPLTQRSAHSQGRELTCGITPRTFPLMIQGPLMVDFKRQIGGRRSPCIENGALTSVRPPSPERLSLWREAGITVKGRPEWIFVKLYCHGMDSRDREGLLGRPMQDFLEFLTGHIRTTGEYGVHFVTAREMVNIALAACDGQSGNPGEYRDYRLRLITPNRLA